MRRELAIVFRARVTWVAAALGALLVGHGFILAIDLFSASSRSALANRLQAREMDPLLGIVRPTLGGLDLALVLLGPLVAARVLSAEKERCTWGALCLAERSPARVIAGKTMAALLGCTLFMSIAVALFLAYRVVGGHMDGLETMVALGGEGLRMLLVVAVSMAAAAWTQTLAHAATLGVAFSLTSWAIDAADGFAALAWLGGASAWSIERQLAPLTKGLVPVGPLLWILAAAAAGFALACVGGSFARSTRSKARAGAAIVVGGALLMAGAGRIRRAYDWTEARRASLPEPVVTALRALPGPIEVEVLLDRDDSRRRQLESDTLQKLVLARPDIDVHMPFDDLERSSESGPNDPYGRITIHANHGARETRSTSRREIVTLIFEAAGRTLPEWTQPAYPGYPVVIEGGRRMFLVSLAYIVIPLVLLTMGFCLSQRRTAR